MSQPNGHEYSENPGKDRKIREEIALLSKKSSPVRTGMFVDAIKRAFIDNLSFSLAKDQFTATERDKYLSLAYTVRDRLVKRWIHTQQQYHYHKAKRVYYLSMEFLIGRILGTNIINLGIYNECTKGMQELGIDVEELRELESDAGLGNGGLGRLAACYLSSMATLSIPAHGYGIRYEYGMFNQVIQNGQQVEKPDDWLTSGNPWEIARPESSCTVRYYGRVESHRREDRDCFEWVDTQDVVALPYDTPIPGYLNGVVNTLRLWSAKSTNEFDLAYFNDGDYVKACESKSMSENISKVLYPNDSATAGKELRLRQQYFFVAASIHDILRRFKTDTADLSLFPDKVAIQLNDTHPVTALVELMRVLIDEEGLDWLTAWGITVRTFAYTNHTILPEALETWDVSMLERLLPRHMQIIYEINYRFLRDVANRYPGDTERLGRMSIIQESPRKAVRMAHLAIVGSHSTNGVSKLHSELLKTRIFRDFVEFFPERFNCKTNGIEPRRWLRKANPALSDLITEAIGEDWVRDLDQLKKLVPFAQDPEFVKKWARVKRHNKARFARFVAESFCSPITVDAMFDVQVKRIHEYKRQLLNVLYLIHAYMQMKRDPNYAFVPKVSFFGGKAAPGYAMAKLVIRFINAVGNVINNDPQIDFRLKVIFLPNYRVSLAEKIFPASDLSEQISTAGMEASGTGNMKFSINGALTIGTLDGANIEIMEEVGRENIFIFGKTAEQVDAMRREGYNPRHYHETVPALQEILELIRCGFFSPENPRLFMPIYEHLLNQDTFFVMADFEDYVRCQNEVSKLYQDPDEWTRKCILNVANMGKFSSDRAVREYANEIWDVKPFDLSHPDERETEKNI